MNSVLPPVTETVPVQKPAPRRVFHRILLHCLFLLTAAAAFVAYQHFKLNGQSTAASTACCLDSRDALAGKSAPFERPASSPVAQR